MRKLLIIFVFIIISTHSIAQWNVFVGGGANIALFPKTTISANYYTYGATTYKDQHKLSSGVGSGGEFGFSYLLKKHHLFITKLSFSQQHFKDDFSRPNFSYNKEDSSNYLASWSLFSDQIYENILQIPLIYGYSFKLPNSVFITPFVGWNNTFSFGGSNSSILEHRKIYSGYAQAGLRLRYRFLFLDASYNLTLTPIFDRIRSFHAQSVYLSFGYVHTMLSKEQRKAKGKIGTWRLGFGIGDAIGFNLFGLKSKKYSLNHSYGTLPNSLSKITTTYSPSWHRFAEMPLSFQYKRHLFFIPFRIGYQSGNILKQVIQYDNYYNKQNFDETIYHYKSAEFELPICYGFDVINKERFSLFPYIGLSNTIQFLSKHTNVQNQAINDYYSNSFYTTGALVGLRFRVNQFYLCAEYKVTIYGGQNMDYYHAVGLNLGYCGKLLKKKKP